MPTPSQGSDQQDLAIAGFRACAQEAIRFLIEEEHLPGDDPLVLGLWRHLAMQELSIDLDSMLSQYAAEGDSGIHDSSEGHPMADDDEGDSTGDGGPTLEQLYSELSQLAKGDERSGRSSSSEDSPDNSTMASGLDVSSAGDAVS
ncbi:unnamed protein product [Ixodes persulcatus]